MRSVLALVACAGCASFIDGKAASSTYRILEASMTAAKRQPDVQLARDAMPGGIMQLDGFALAYPDFGGFRTLRAESLCQYAVAFVFDDWEDAALAGRDDDAKHIATRLGGLLAACVDANLAMLRPAWRAARANGELEAMLPRATTSDVAALRWIATADAIAIAVDPLPNLGKLAPAMATLERTTVLAPLAHDADSELLLGTLEAAKSAIFHGSDGSARFAAARAALGDGALVVDVMFARGVAVAHGDRALFERTLQHVLDANVERWPERRLSNELARQKARRYLAAEGRLLK